MRIICAALACLASSSAMAEPVMTPATSVPIQQDRDEPGRNPYQVHFIIPSDCEPYDCTISFPKITAKERVVVQQVSCAIQTPEANIPIYVFLAGKVSDPYLRSYLALSYQGYNSGVEYYVASTQVLFYFVTGDTPSIDIYRTGGPSAAPQGDCAISGYRVLLP
jgi:hypothetical protein